ncbi:Wzz/FepE/Etk N-terminal domain-containing protein [Pseudomonas guariconensis]|uniref:LPS O-antigen chain length determinant protein WzzB n=1 Tax=Pseudomonas guariconensis TaxID=1288410 RepID=UPI0025AA04A8|nr:Wzz/FepE/Etk N-terminal domain-containing protein [Pseudomonas guariconensis]MDM9595262.1 Wzz/FepE/Etk N-terminal domain-containing protein [Pseudomonas guariconensis]MDM9608092.1 Wzz/FepE/Etk N-terminal domain-containing protein [Pseudomonas guariconensis]MDM9613049.1 Wzz/FepE/Etk N-terminal domain-containing protein [Pseudomonas guariconensis]
MRSERERLSGGDEIDLFELIEGLWKKKLLIIVTAAIVMSLAVGYAFLATPIYEAKIFVQPPSQNDIAQLNYGRGGESELEPFKVKDVSGIFLRTLQSESLRREFFRRFYLPSLSDDQRNGSQDALYNQFIDVLTFGVASKETPDRFYVTANLSDPQQAAEWVARYIDMAGERAKSEVIKDARADAMIKADNLEQLINALRESARKEREDRIVKLTEALNVALSVGLEKPPIISYGPSSEISADMDGPLTYMRGSKALKAEIENLRGRASDDAFIDDLRQKQESLNFYRSLKINPAVVQVYRQDGILESPDQPVKPKKSIIILMGGVIGVVLGSFLALVSHLWVRREGSGAVI